MTGQDVRDMVVALLVLAVAAVAFVDGQQVGVAEGRGLIAFQVLDLNQRITRITAHSDSLAQVWHEQGCVWIPLTPQRPAPARVPHPR